MIKRIGADVKRELGRFGAAGGMADLVTAWPAAVGEQIARNAWPARIARDGTLHVATSSSAWAFELAHLESALRELYHPDGINLGMNIGKAAGAGIAGHIHMHVLPRWVADANFVSVVCETRVLPEMLEETWHRMTKALGT